MSEANKGGFREELEQVRAEALKHFDSPRIQDQDDSRCRSISARLATIATEITTALRTSPLVGDAEMQKLRLRSNEMRSALKFRHYEFQPSYLDYDEDICRGRVPEQSWETEVSVETAKQLFLVALHEVEQILDLLPVARASATKTSPKQKLANWGELEIIFVSDHRIQVVATGYSESFNYAEFGLEDARTKTPSKAWYTLLDIAKTRGRLPPSSIGGVWPLIEKRVQKLRGLLRSRFECPGDPLLSQKGIGYVANFKISCGPSFTK